MLEFVRFINWILISRWKSIQVMAMPVETVARPLHHPIFADLTDETGFGDAPPSLGRSSEQHPRALFADPYLEDFPEVANGLCY